jgi:ElaB/YqjD/DUF883 family membrane-anchored ribosome-binding protein
MSTSTKLAIQEDLAEAADRTKEFASAVGSMASQAAIDAGSLVSQAASDVGRKAEDLTANAEAGIKDLAQLIQRNPIPSVLIAAGLGWFVGRKLRS